MRFIDPSTYVSSWTPQNSVGLRIDGAQSAVSSGGYTIYTFTTTGINNAVITGRGVADILIVGGGGGGTGLGGGGGAGGFIYRQNVLKKNIGTCFYIFLIIVKFISSSLLTVHLFRFFNLR